jgi:hypothetical protein
MKTTAAMPIDLFLAQWSATDLQTVERGFEVKASQSASPHYQCSQETSQLGYRGDEIEVDLRKLGNDLFRDERDWHESLIISCYFLSSFRSECVREVKDREGTEHNRKTIPRANPPIAARIAKPVQ